MLQFTHSLAISLLHSLWQSAFLCTFYFLLVKSIPQPHPLFKRNLLFKLISIQVIATIVTFFCYFLKPNSDFVTSIPTLFSGFNIVDQFILQYSIWILSAYLMIVFYKMVRQLYLWKSFKQQYKMNLVKPNAELKLFLTGKALQFGIKKPISLWLSHNITTPVVFGYFKPVILLPIALMNKLSIQQTESLIIHELTHIKQNDFLLNCFLLLGESIYFFNPFIQIMSKMIKIEREKSCDLQVLNFNYPMVEYAESLLAIASYPVQQRKFHIGAFSKRSVLFERIQFFSKNPSSGNPSKQTLIWGILTGFFLLSGTYILLSKNEISIRVSKTKISIPSPTNENFGTANIEEMPTNVWNTSAVTPIETATKTKTKVKSKEKIETVEVEHLDDGIPAHSEYLAIPVSLSLNNPEEANTNIKEVVVKEENSEGQKLTKVFTLELKDGNWITQPKWLIKEGTSKDTIHLNKITDSAWQIKVIAPVQ